MLYFKNLVKIMLVVEKNPKKAFKETQQEVMIDLAVKTNNFFEKLKAETKKNRVAF